MPTSHFVKLAPMYAAVGTVIPEGDRWAFEPKYDGIRVLALVSPDKVYLVTRNNNDKSAQFPEIVTALQQLATRRNRTMTLDGEIVAVRDDTLGRFQDLQSRMHVQNPADIKRYVKTEPVVFIAFDILTDNEENLMREPWRTRRTRLEQRIGKRPPNRIHLTESIIGGGARMLRRAQDAGWEGIMAKAVDAKYHPGIRSRQWLKLKIEFRQEFVVGGYTEPRKSREYFGALLLGYFDKKKQLIYVGHTGGGFTRNALADMYARLKPLERKQSPFSTPIRTNERAHWVEPKIVVEVKFLQWTSDGRLRAPIFLGARDDISARTVGREPKSVQR